MFILVVTGRQPNYSPSHPPPAPFQQLSWPVSYKVTVGIFWFCAFYSLKIRFLVAIACFSPIVNYHNRLSLS